MVVFMISQLQSEVFIEVLTLNFFFHFFFFLGDYILDAKPKEISEIQRLNYEQVRNCF